MREREVGGIWGGSGSRVARRLTAGAVAGVGARGGAASGRAADHPAFSVTFPDGTACAGFDVQVDGFGAGPQAERTFVDRDGNEVRTLSAGTGFALVFTNLAAGTSYSTRSNGTANHTTL